MMMSKRKSVRKKITDLFKSMFKGRSVKAREPQVQAEKTETAPKSSMFQPRKKPAKRWVSHHNMNQAHRAHKIQKRRKANKVARKMRQTNQRKAA